MDGGRGRSRGRLAGRSRQVPALAVSALVAGQQPTVGRGQRACPGLLTGLRGPVMRSHAGSLQAVDLAGPSPRTFPHNSLSLLGAGSWEPGEAERGAERSGWADREDWGRVQQIRSFSHAHTLSCQTSWPRERSSSPNLLSHISLLLDLWVTSAFYLLISDFYLLNKQQASKQENKQNSCQLEKYSKRFN